MSPGKVITTYSLAEKQFWFLRKNKMLLWHVSPLDFQVLWQAALDSGNSHLRLVNICHFVYFQSSEVQSPDLSLAQTKRHSRPSHVLIKISSQNFLLKSRFDSASELCLGLSTQTYQRYIQGQIITYINETKKSRLSCLLIHYHCTLVVLYILRVAVITSSDVSFDFLLMKN